MSRRPYRARFAAAACLMAWAAPALALERQPQPGSVMVRVADREEPASRRQRRSAERDAGGLGRCGRDLHRPPEADTCGPARDPAPGRDPQLRQSILRNEMTDLPSADRRKLRIGFRTSIVTLFGKPVAL